MINILLTSHSKKLAQGLKEIMEQMAPDVLIDYSGGTSDGQIGSNFDEISEKINKLSEGDGLVVFFDLGSSMMNCQMAIDFLDDDRKSKVILAGTAYVESSIQIAVNISAGQSLDDIREFIDTYPINKLDGNM